MDAGIVIGVAGLIIGIAGIIYAVFANRRGETQREKLVAKYDQEREIDQQGQVPCSGVAVCAFGSV